MPSILIDNPIDKKHAPRPKRRRNQDEEPESPKQGTNAGLLDALPKDEEEMRLEEMLFGQKSSILDVQKDNGQKSEEEDNDEDIQALGFVIDTASSNNAVVSMEMSGSDAESVESEQERKPAWHDPDDDEMQINITNMSRLRKLRETEDEEVVSAVEYQKRLRRQFEKVHPIPSWALMDEQKSKGNSELWQLLQSSTSIIQDRRKLKALPQEVLEVTRVKDANQLAYSNAVIQTISWHPNGQVMLTGGFDKTIRLFQIDGKINPHLQNIFLRDLPIHHASFTRDGKEIIASGRRRYFYSFDLESGQPHKVWDEHKDDKSLETFTLSPDNQYIAFLLRDGYVGLASRASKQWIADFKMSSTVKSVSFSSDGKTMYSFSKDGEVYHWDLGERKCIHRFHDEGAVKPKRMATSGSFLATGHNTGIVNLYDVSNLKSNNPSPLKAFGNLTTSINTLNFNHDSQILAISSKAKKDSLRLVHTPSCTVFKNWPTSSTPLGYVNAVEFSPNSGYIAVGNDRGKVLLYRLNHYPRA